MALFNTRADCDWPRLGRVAVNNDIRGLIDSVNDGSTSAFMWEWFTTKPFADAGECRFVRPLPSRPRPPWLILLMADLRARPQS